jgi:hypothetical protein
VADQSKHASRRLAERYDALVRALGYEERATFLTAQTVDEQNVTNHVIRQALKTIGVLGVFALDDGFRSSSIKPIVYLASAADEGALRALRKDVWSQGAAPFLLIVTQEKVELCNGFEPPSASSVSIDFDPKGSSFPAALANFSAERISSSITWGDLEVHCDSSVDNKLVDAIEALNDRARQEFTSMFLLTGRYSRSIGSPLACQRVSIRALCRSCMTYLVWDRTESSGRRPWPFRYSTSSTKRSMAPCLH